MSNRMGRCKDEDWYDLPNQWGFVHVRVLQDIRDELKQLNRILGCSNTLRIPHTLEAIRVNTIKPRPKRKRKKAHA